MADYLSGSIHFTGLGNGTDFDTMISQLKEIEMVPAKRLLKWKADWQKRVDAFQEVRTKLVELQTAAAKMNSVDKFLVKTAESSSSSVAGAVATSSAQTGTYRVEVAQVATNAYWSMSTGFNDTSAVVNSSGEMKSFVYQYKGTTHSVSVPAGTTLKSLENLINNDTKNPGVKVSLINAAGGYTFQMRGLDTGTENSLYITQADLNGFTSGTPSYSPYTAQYNTAFTDPSDVVNTTGAFTYQYTYNGRTRSLSIPANATLQDLADAINNDSDNPGVTADLVLNGGAYALTLTGDPALGGSPISAATDNTLTPGLGALVSTYSPEANPGDWHVQQSQNARFRINGWPVDYMETSSNTVSDVAEGMTFTLKDAGSTVITVNTDTEKIKENVQTFIDAVNGVRSIILELTKYDNTKTTASLEVATSLYEMQKGSILTGNYGVQLLSSQLKQATAGTPKGFTPLLETMLSDGSSFWTGDIFSSLSQLGIKTMADGQSGSTNFGLLVLNTDPSLPTLDSVLAANPEAVAEFFSAANQGKSDSPDFSFSSQVTSITRPGIYDVSYEVDSNGQIISAFINGKAAKYYPETGELGITNAQPASGNANLVTATFDGAADATHTVEVLQLATAGSMTFDREYDSGTDVLTTAEQGMTFVIDGQVYETTINADETLEEFVARINGAAGSPITASFAENGNGKLQLTFTTKAVGEKAEIVGFLSGGALGARTSTAGQNAEYVLDGTTRTSESNVIANVVPGWTFTLKGAEPGTTVTLTGQAFNAADGIMIRPDNLSPGTHSGTVRIKQGKINELLELLNGPPGKSEQGMLGQDGALGILDRNYKTIMDNIQKKVEREDARIVKWERLMRLRFSRLEATLSRYDNLSKSVESQIKQLGNNSSS